MKKFAYTLLATLLITINVYAADVATGNTAVVDGNVGEWSGSHFLANMHRAWKTSKDVLSKAYAMYDCENGILYFRVVRTDYPIIVDGDGSDVYIKAGKSKLVSSADDGNSGYPKFSWVNRSGAYADGWEAAVVIAPGTYEKMAIHNNVYDGESQTSGRRDFEITINCDGGALDVEFSGVEANLDNRSVTIRWNAIEESNHAGYNVLRKDESGEFVRVNESLIVPAFFGTMVENIYEYVDDLNESGEYTYVIEAISTAGESSHSEAVNVVFATSAVENDELVPALFNLNQNYPNPFNPTTTISYELPETALATLIVFDALGRQVAELVNEIQAAGSYQVTWNAADSDQTLASGIYFYSLQAGDYHMTNRMMLVK